MLDILKWRSARRHALGAAAIALWLAGPAPGQAQETIRIGLPTKTYYPTIIAETALRQGLFAKEGIKAELTIYRSGSETFEAMAAGAADLQLNSASSPPAAERACRPRPWQAPRSAITVGT